MGVEQVSILIVFTRSHPTDTCTGRNWIYRSDDNLYASRWQQILDSSFDPELVQIISWNDYGESHCMLQSSEGDIVPCRLKHRPASFHYRHWTHTRCTAWI